LENWDKLLAALPIFWPKVQKLEELQAVQFLTKKCFARTIGPNFLTKKYMRQKGRGKNGAHCRAHHLCSAPLGAFCVLYVLQTHTWPLFWRGMSKLAFWPNMDELQAIFPGFGKPGKIACSSSNFCTACKRAVHLNLTRLGGISGFGIFRKNCLQLFQFLA